METDSYNSIKIMYKSNSSYVKYFNLPKPVSYNDLVELKDDIIKGNYYVLDIVSLFGAEEVDDEKKLNPPVFIMNIDINKDEFTEDDLKIEESKMEENKTIWTSKYNFDEEAAKEAYQEYLDDLENNEEAWEYEDWLESYFESDSNDQWEVMNEYFSNEIYPMIEAQCNHDVLILLGSLGRWNGTFNACKILYNISEQDIRDLWNDYDEVSIDEDNNILCMKLSHHDGTDRLYLYTLPEDLTELGTKMGYIEDDEDINTDVIYESLDEDVIANNVNLLIPITNKLNNLKEQVILENKFKNTLFINIDDVWNAFENCENEDDIKNLIKNIPNKFGTFSYKVNGPEFTVINYYEQYGDYQDETFDFEFVKPNLEENKEIIEEDLDANIINPSDKDYYDNLYEIGLYPGAGVELELYKVYANYEEEAFEILVAYLEKKENGAYLIDCTAVDPEDMDNYVYIDATQEGASQPYYLDVANAQIHEIDSALQESYLKENEEDEEDEDELLDLIKDRIDQVMTVGELNSFLQSIFAQYNTVFLLRNDILDMNPDETQYLTIYDDSTYQLSYEIVDENKGTIKIIDAEKI